MQGLRAHLGRARPLISMTRIVGKSLIGTPCCHSVYYTPLYGSINYSATAYWTDGYKENSLATSVDGLRKCKCGAFYFLKDAVGLGTNTDPDIQPAQPVLAADLADATLSDQKPIELAARLAYWHYLNHPYREQYRAHRDKLNKKPTRIQALSKNLLDWMTINKKPPADPNKPFSMPDYQPSQLQIDNMERLLELLLNIENEAKTNLIDIAEIYRELGRIDQASAALDMHTGVNDQRRKDAVRFLIKDRLTGPARHR